MPETKNIQQEKISRKKHLSQRNSKRYNGGCKRYSKDKNALTMPITPFQIDKNSFLKKRTIFIRNIFAYFAILKKLYKAKGIEFDKNWGTTPTEEELYNFLMWKTHALAPDYHFVWDEETKTLFQTKETEVSVEDHSVLIWWITIMEKDQHELFECMFQALTLFIFKLHLPTWNDGFFDQCVSMLEDRIGNNDYEAEDDTDGEENKKRDQETYEYYKEGEPKQWYDRFCVKIKTTSVKTLEKEIEKLREKNPTNAFLTDQVILFAEQMVYLIKKDITSSAFWMPQPVKEELFRGQEEMVDGSETITILWRQDSVLDIYSEFYDDVAMNYGVSPIMKTYRHSSKRINELVSNENGVKDIYEALDTLRTICKHYWKIYESN